MSKAHMLAVARVLTAIVVLAAVLTQYVASWQTTPNFSPVNFFSFFTVESNVFGAVVLLSAAFYSGKFNRALTYKRGAATLYMVVTGIIYSLLLTGVDVQASVSWCNAVLHYIFPVLILADWLVDRPKRTVSLKTSLVWLIFPLLYGIYSVVRGTYAHWYPYPFLNVAKFGYSRVLINAALVAVVFIALTLLLASVPKFFGAKKATNR